MPSPAGQRGQGLGGGGDLGDGPPSVHRCWGRKRLRPQESTGQFGGGSLGCQVCPASLIKRNTEGRPGEKQVTVACPTSTERAENGASYSFWALYRESLKEATQANHPPSPARVVRIGFPTLGGKRENTEGTSGVPRSRVGWEAKAKDVLAICPSLGVVPFPYPWATVAGPSSPVGTSAGTAHTSGP